MGTQSANKEYYDYLEGLSSKKFFGEVTLFFQDGMIEKSKQTEFLPRTVLIERMGGKGRIKVNGNHPPIPRPSHG